MKKTKQNKCCTCNCKKNSAPQVRVEIVESELGWGQKVDSVRHFPTLEEAQEFIREYNKDNNLKTVPEWYMYARLA